MMDEKEFDKYTNLIKDFAKENFPKDINYIIGLSAATENENTLISNIGINSSFRGMVAIARNLNERVIDNDKDMTLSKLVEMYDKQFSLAICLKIKENRYCQIFLFYELIA